MTLRSAGTVIIAETRGEECGFKLPNPGVEPDGHAGLAGMRERAELTGGSLTIQTAPGRRSAIRAAVPMADPGGEQW